MARANPRKMEVRNKFLKLFLRIYKTAKIKAQSMKNTRKTSFIVILAITKLRFSKAITILAKTAIVDPNRRKVSINVAGIIAVPNKTLGTRQASGESPKSFIEPA